MNLNNIEEARILIEKLRTVQSAKSAIAVLLGEDGMSDGEFALIDKGTEVVIALPYLKEDVLHAITAILNYQCEKITARLKEI